MTYSHARTTATPTSMIPPTAVAIEDSWIDYNGHLSEGYFVLAFSRAIDDMLDHVGLGEVYRSATNCALFTVEAHIRYRNQVRAGTTVDIRNRIYAVDAKRLRSVHEMYVGDTLCATEEVTGLHVDRTVNKVIAFPSELRATLAALSDDDPAPTMTPQAGWTS